jgi:hypothetical protein
MIAPQRCQVVEQAGREPAEVGIEVWVSMGSGAEADRARETRFWKEAGCSHVTLTTNFNRRIPGRTMGGQGAQLAERVERAGRGLMPASSIVCHWPLNVTCGSAHGACITSTCSSDRAGRAPVTPGRGSARHPGGHR